MLNQDRSQVAHGESDEAERPNADDISQRYPSSEESAIKMGFRSPVVNRGSIEPDIGYIGGMVATTVEDKTSGQILTINGVIVDSQGVAMRIADVSTGKVLSITGNTHRIQNIFIKPPENPPNWQKVQIYAYHGDHTLDTIQSFNGRLAVLEAGLDPMGGDRFAVSGTIAVTEALPGYRVIQIADTLGRTHLVDPRYLHFGNLVVAQNEAGQIEEPVPSLKEPIHLIDESREARSELVRTLIEDMERQHIQPFANPRLYDYLGSHVTPEDLGALFSRWYGHDARLMTDVLAQSIGPDALPILADPGVVSHFEQFRTFLEANGSNLRGLSAYKVRERFSQDLGYTTIYRGRAMSEKEAQIVRDRGLETGSLAHPDVLRDVLLDMFDPHTIQVLPPLSSIRIQSIEDAIKARQIMAHGASREYDLLASLSEDPGLALSIGWHASSRVNEAEVSPYEIAMRVPMVDVIVSEAGVFSATERYTHKVAEHEGKIHTSGIEVYYPFCAPSGYIVGVTKRPLPNPIVHISDSPNF